MTTDRTDRQRTTEFNEGDRVVLPIELGGGEGVIDSPVSDIGWVRVSFVLEPAADASTFGYAHVGIDPSRLTPAPPLRPAEPEGDGTYVALRWRGKWSGVRVRRGSSWLSLNHDGGYVPPGRNWLQLWEIADEIYRLDPVLLPADRSAIDGKRMAP